MEARLDRMPPSSVCDVVVETVIHFEADFVASIVILSWKGVAGSVSQKAGTAVAGTEIVDLFGPRNLVDDSLNQRIDLDPSGLQNIDSANLARRIGVGEDTV